MGVRLGDEVGCWELTIDATDGIAEFVAEGAQREASGGEQSAFFSEKPQAGLLRKPS